jgi:prophage antirepressor-like protein
MSAVQLFEFDSIQIRTLQKDGEPWFVAKDVAVVLGYSNPRKTVGDHCKNAISGGVTIRDAIGREQKYTIIPERDVYRLVMRSKLPSAEKFEEWVVGEVLPSIRKTGSYSTAPVLPTYSEALRQLADKIEENEAMKPKVEHYEAVISTGKTMLVREAGKLIGIGERKLYAFLKQQQFIMESKEPYMRYVDAGLFEWKEGVYLHNGNPIEYKQLRVTPKGVDAIRRAWDKYNELERVA